MTTGATIRDARERAELTLEELGRRVGTTKQHVWRWEHDQIQPTLKYLAALCRVLDLDLSDLTGDGKTVHETHAPGAP